MVDFTWKIQTRTGHVAAGNHLAEFLNGGCAMIPPLADIVEMPTAVTLVSGKDARNHLNRMLTVDVSNDSILSRKESFICDLNGRITTYQLHVDLGEQILLLHNHSMSEILRKTLTSGIPWNETIEISSGDGVVHRILIYGKKPEKILGELGINQSELHTEHWTEFLNSMISVIKIEDEFSIYEMVIASRDYSKITDLLKNNGAGIGEVNSAMAILSIAGTIDYSVDVSGYIPFNLGLGRLVDLKKGCYPGQEIHARMESRGGIKKSTSTFKTKMQMRLGKTKSTNKERLEIISSQQFGESWFNLLIHPRDISLSSEIFVNTPEGEITLTSV